MGHSWFPIRDFFQNQYALYVIRAIWLHFQGKPIILEKNVVSFYAYQRIVSLMSLMSFSDFSLTIPQWENDQTKAAGWVEALWRLPVRRIWIPLSIPAAFCFLKLFDYQSTHDHAGRKKSCRGTRMTKNLGNATLVTCHRGILWSPGTSGFCS